MTTSTPAPQADPFSTKDNQRTRGWSIAAHVSTLPSILGSTWIISALRFIGPVVCIAAAGRRDPVVYDHARHSLNFQLSLTLYRVPLLWVTVFLMRIQHELNSDHFQLYNGFPLQRILFQLPSSALTLFWIICVVLQTVRANRAEPPRSYPLAIPFISARLTPAQALPLAIGLPLVLMGLMFALMMVALRFGGFAAH